MLRITASFDFFWRSDDVGRMRLRGVGVPVVGWEACLGALEVIGEREIHEDVGVTCGHSEVEIGDSGVILKACSVDIVKRKRHGRIMEGGQFGRGKKKLEVDILFEEGNSAHSLYRLDS